jgi:hypothetical protein
MDRETYTRKKNDLREIKHVFLKSLQGDNESLFLQSCRFLNVF